MAVKPKLKEHKKAECSTPKPTVQHMYYVYKGWKALFRCPTCARECWQHLNFLGQRTVFCNGVKFIKERKED